VLTKAPAYLAALAVGLGALLTQGPAAADGFNPMSMMNPTKWFGKRGDSYGPDDDLPPPPPPGYGGPPMGTPYGPPPGPGYGPPPPGYAGPAALPPGGLGPGYAPPGAPPIIPRGGYTGGYGAPAAPYAAPPSTAAGYGMAQAPGYRTPAVASTDTGPTREEMENRIKDLEKRLEDMEAKNRENVPAPQPTSPPPTSYQYYSGDQTPTSAAKYPFRPLDLGR
jgi:hypothetical protein